MWSDQLVLTSPGSPAITLVGLAQAAAVLAAVVSPVLAPRQVENSTLLESELPRTSSTAW